MRRKSQMIRRTCTATFAAALLGALIAPASASRPVHKTITGCVEHGVLTSDDGYEIHIRNANDRKPVDLAPYEGREIRYEGSLLPGDIFFVGGKPEDLGPCR